MATNTNTDIYKEFLKGYYPFSDVPEDVLSELSLKIRVRHFGVGKTIYTKGDRGEMLYVIRTGSVYETVIDREDKEVVVAVLNQGECFGVISLLTDENHLVTTKAKDDVEVYTILKDDLDALIEKYPYLNKYLNRILKNRIDQFFTFFEKEKIAIVKEVKDADEKEKELSFLTKVTELMNSESPDTVLKSITYEMKKVMDADSCSIFLLDKLSSELILEASSGLGEKSLKSARLKLDEGITGWVVRSGEPETVEDVHSDQRTKFIEEIHEERLVSLLSVPLKERGRVIGAINIATANKRKFSYQEVRGAVILANHIALAVSNSRLRIRIKAASGVNDSQKTNDLEKFVGETSYVKRTNSFIESASKHEEPVLINGEEGTGKTLMAKLIHKKGRRHKGPFVVVNCQTFNKDSWGAEIFGSEVTKGSDRKKQHGYLELADSGTIYFTNIDALNKVNQVKLYNFLRDEKFNRVGGKDILTSNVRVISTTSINLDEMVKQRMFNKSLYEILSSTTISMDPLKKRRKDIPLITRHILENLNKELHKNIGKISDFAMERLLSYDWPGNVLELENVLRRGYLLAVHDEILSEQIFFGLPRVESKWEFNLLSFEWIKKLATNRYYPIIPQLFNLAMFVLFFLILAFGVPVKKANQANLIIWSAGWMLLYMSALVVGRLWCGVCPFSLIGDRFKKIKGFEFELPRSIIRNSDIILTLFILSFFWIEGVSAMTNRPDYTAYLLLSIPIGAALFSVLFERHVWCRYICPLGGLLGLFSIFSFVKLRANRKICLSQCGTHECYLGGRVGACPVFLHPYGIENNQNCTLCLNCYKNCDHNSIHLPIRMPFSQIPYIEPSKPIISFLALAFCGILFVENGALLSIDSYIFRQLLSAMPLSKEVLYTLLFIMAAALPIMLFYLFNIVFNRLPLELIHKRIKVFGFAFIPLSLMAHMSFFFKKVINEGRGFGKWAELIYDLFYVGEHRLGPALYMETLAIIAGAAGTIYIVFKAEKKFVKQYELKKTSINGEVILVSLLFCVYLIMTFVG